MKKYLSGVVKILNRYVDFLLGVVTQTLQIATIRERPIFDHVIECTRALLEFYMYSCCTHIVRIH
jgi:hypothetical protein